MRLDPLYKKRTNHKPAGDGHFTCTSCHGFFPPAQRERGSNCIYCKACHNANSAKNHEQRRARGKLK